MTDGTPSNDPVQRLINGLRAPVPVPPGFPARVERRRRHQRTVRHLRQGGSVLLLVLIAIVATRTRASGTTVTFSIAAPGSRSVALVGDFTDWRSDRVQLQRASSGTWRATVKLPPGRYRFAYLIDQNQWRADATAAPVQDDFGRPTSVVTVVSN
jgi:1,4-alpha-glucan branching enzyme